MAQSDIEAARLTVRLGALKENYRAIERRAGAGKVAPVVKADGYGCGMIAVSRPLAGIGANTFFVARIQEGIDLRKALPNVRIFVLDGLKPGTAALYRSHNLIPVLNALEEISEWSAAARDARTKLDAVVQLDTGMNRSGLSRHDIETLCAEAKARLSGINVSLWLSHLSCSDDPKHPMNRQQLQRFRAQLAKLPPAPASISASGGIGLERDYDMDMVRPGLALYGGNPQPALPNPYRVVAQLTGRILQVRRVDSGDTVGYGATFTAGKPLKLVTVSLGYADGLSRVLAGRGQVSLGGVRIPFAGRISMDLAVLDATQVPDAACKRGAEVEFFGDNISLEEVADAANTMSYEILTGISPRVPRVHVEG